MTGAVAGGPRWGLTRGLPGHGAVHRVRRGSGPGRAPGGRDQRPRRVSPLKDELPACWPGELERWHALCEERERGRARSWLAAAGYRVLAVEYRDS